MGGGSNVDIPLAGKNVTLFTHVNYKSGISNYFVSLDRAQYTKEDLMRGDPVKQIERFVLHGLNLNVAIVDKEGDLYKVKKKKNELGELVDTEVPSIQCGPRLKWLMEIMEGDSKMLLEDRISKAIKKKFDSVVDQFPDWWLAQFDHTKQEVKGAFNPSLNAEDAKQYLLDTVSFMLCTNGKDAVKLRESTTGEAKSFVKYVKQVAGIPEAANINLIRNLFYLSESERATIMQAIKGLRSDKLDALSEERIGTIPSHFVIIAKNAENLDPDKIKVLSTTPSLLPDKQFEILTQEAPNLTPEKIKLFAQDITNITQKSIDLYNAAPQFGDDGFRVLVEGAKNLQPSRIKAFLSSSEIKSCPLQQLQMLVEAAKGEVGKCLQPDQIKAFLSSDKLGSFPVLHLKLLVNNAIKGQDQPDKIKRSLQELQEHTWALRAQPRPVEGRNFIL